MISPQFTKLMLLLVVAMMSCAALEVRASVLTYCSDTYDPDEGKTFTMVFCCKPLDLSASSFQNSPTDMVGCIKKEDAGTLCADWPVTKHYEHNGYCPCGPLEPDVLNVYMWTSCPRYDFLATCSKVDSGTASNQTQTECSEAGAPDVDIGTAVGIFVTLIWLGPLLGICCCCALVGGCVYMIQMNQRNNGTRTYITQEQLQQQQQQQQQQQFPVAAWVAQPTQNQPQQQSNKLYPNSY